MADPDAGKLFVGGLSRDTTETTLRDHFSQYGDVSFSIIARDRITGAPRGFGFVTFFDVGLVDKALDDPHIISGRTVEVKKARPRNEHQTNSQREQHIYQQSQRGNVSDSRNSFGSSNNTEPFFRTKKIFVGGLSSDLTEDEFKAYFGKFGRITDVVVMHDNNTNRPRGFGFITFDSEQVVENIMQKSHHELGGKRVEVKRAVPREVTKNLSNNGNSSRYNGNGNGNGRFSTVSGYEENYGGVRGPVIYGGSYPVATTTTATTYPGFYYNGGVYGGGGYPVGAYGFYGYGMPFVPSPRTTWNGFGMMGVPTAAAAYGTGYYPTNVNGGVAMMGIVNSYDNIMDPMPPTKDAATTSPMNGGGKSDGNDKKSSRVPDAQAQTKVAPVSQSS